jgi:hypothetical protein
MTLSDTARFWLDWCKFQKIDAADVIIELYYILFQCLPKKNTFMFVGESDAGKTFWTDPLIIPDICGQVITSADFMWQECTGKDLILVPELTLSKYDQVEGFKKVAEGMPTLVNVKNKAAVLLQRTPMLVTTNSYPWKFFNDEEASIKNRMFFYEVRKYNWNSPKAPTPTFFASLFKSIRKFVDGDEFFPYDVHDDDHYAALYEAVMGQIKSMAIPKVQPGTSLVHEASCDLEENQIYIPWAAPQIPDKFWERVHKGDEYSMRLVKSILMCFSDDEVNLYCKWNTQDKLDYVDIEKVKDISNVSMIWSFLERCLNELQEFKGPVCDGMSTFQKNMRKYYKMIEMLSHRAVFLLSNVSVPDELPPPTKRVKFDYGPPTPGARKIIGTADMIKAKRSMSVEELKNTTEMLFAGVPSAEIKKYIETCKSKKSTPTATVTATSTDKDSGVGSPSSTIEVVEDGTCYGCKHDKPGQRDHMGPGGCLEYEKQDQQGKAALNERNPHMTQQQEPMARSPGGPQTQKGQGNDTLIIK